MVGEKNMDSYQLSSFSFCVVSFAKLTHRKNNILLKADILTSEVSLPKRGGSSPICARN